MKNHDLITRIRRAILRVLDQAVEPERLGELYPLAVVRLIDRAAARLTYERLVPFGGEREQGMIARFRRLAGAGMEKAFELAEAFRNVLGYGYVRHPLCGDTKEQKEQVEWHRTMLQQARLARQRDQAWLHEQVLLGRPSRVMDFDIECKYLIRKADGSVERQVRLWNVVGEGTKLVRLDNEAFASPEKFRKWGLSQGNFCFGVGGRAGVQELNRLQHDLAREAAFKVVTEISEYGAHEQEDGTVLWFFRDGVVLPDGQVARPDRNDILWHGEQGYRMADQPPLNDGVQVGFAQGHPRLHFERSALDLVSWFRNLPRDPRDERAEEEIVGAFFKETCRRLHQTLGSFAGELVLGALISYAAAPELFAAYSGFPGLWVHGLQGSGKSKLIEWLMHVWGFDLPQGLNVRSEELSVVGMQAAANQYCNLPLWFDEYRAAEVSLAKLSVLQNAFNRAGGYKMTRVRRQTRTSFLVSGESTTDDAATRGRYIHVQVSAQRRLADNLGWFSEHCHGFPVFGRWVLQHRAAFVAEVRRRLQAFMDRQELASVDHRIRYVNGVGYASLLALATLLRMQIEEEEFTRWILEQVRGTAQDVAGDTNINTFWDDLLACHHAGDLPLGHFRVFRSEAAHPPGRPGQSLDAFDQPRPWWSYRLYFRPAEVLDAMEKHLRQRGDRLPLRRKDYRDQLATTAYWIAGKLRQRFPEALPVESPVGGIDLDRHPLGYQPISDEEYRAWSALGPEERAQRGDPRKGPLYAIIDALEISETERT